jgi:predicted nucleic-acid-binding protein
VQDTKILWDSIKKDKQQKTHSIENFWLESVLTSKKYVASNILLLSSLLSY